MSAVEGSKIETLERNWRRVASTHTLQDLMSADELPAETGMSFKMLLSGTLLIVAGVACLVFGIFSFGAHWLLPESNNALIKAIRDDNYYHLLVPAMVPVTIIAIFSISEVIFIEGKMENHNFAAKRPTDFLGDLPEFNFAEDDIGGDGLNLQFFNFSPNYLNPLAGLENNWLASPWPRGAAATTPQDHLNLRLAMQPTAVLLNSAASPKQRGIARNLDAFSPRGAATTPQRKLPAFPLLGPPSRATVGTQTSPGLECNAHFYGKTKPAAKAPQSFATEPIAGNKNHNQRIKKRNTFSQQGASLPPLPKKAKKVAPAVAVTSRLSSQPSSALSPINNNAPAVHEITVPEATTSTAGHAFQGNNKVNKLDSTAPLVFPLKVPYPPSLNLLPAAAITALPSSGHISGTTSKSTYDSLMCEVCGLGEPDESIILCDGCDLGYHMGCLCPALTQVPAGAWFCDCCCNEMAAELNRQRQQQPAAHPRQYLAAGVTALRPPPARRTPASTLQQQQQQQPVFGPINKRVSRLIIYFSSTDPPVRPTYHAHAQLQVLIFLAEHGDSTTARIRLHHGNNKCTANAVGKLFAAGVIHKVQSSTNECVYALDPTVLPYVEQWKERLQAYARALEAQKKISSDLLSLLRSTEPLPLSDLRQAQLQTLVLLAQLRPSTIPEIRGHLDGNVTFGHRILAPLLKAGLVTCKEGIRAGLTKYALDPDVMPYINEFERKLQQHQIARNTAAAAAAQPTAPPPSLSNPPHKNDHHRQQQQEPQQPQPRASDLPLTVANLFNILCFDNNDGEDKTPPYNLSRRIQLQALIHLGEHGEATIAFLKEMYFSDNATTPSVPVVACQLFDMWRAGMLHRERLTSMGTPYLYRLAPTMQKYLSIWKKKLESDDLKRNASASATKKEEEMKKKATAVKAK
ncbi:hypothetical protein Ndes2437B_g05894 [Nannochloris sp. 'desiccata']